MLRKIKFSNSPLKPKRKNQIFIVRFLVEKVRSITLETTFISICHNLYTVPTFKKSLKIFTLSQQQIPTHYSRQHQKTALVQFDIFVFFTQSKKQNKVKKTVRCSPQRKKTYFQVTILAGGCIMEKSKERFPNRSSPT